MPSPRWLARLTIPMMAGAALALIGVGHLVCYDLSWGWQPQQIADDIHATLTPKGISLFDDGSIVNAAHSNYCPGE